MSIKQSQYDQYVSSGQAGKRMGREPRIQFATNKPFIEQAIRRHIPTANREIRIVDLGCGHGGWIYFLKQHGFTNVAGVDISAEQVAFAHELGVSEVQHGDLDSFLEDESVLDVVILMDILEHFTIAESDALLRKIADRLSPDGRLIIHVPNGEGLFGQRIRYGDLTHETCFTPKSIRQLLAPIGFQNVQCFEDRPVVHGFKSAIRAMIWRIGTFGARALLAAETGTTRFVLSQNMTVVATRT